MRKSGAALLAPKPTVDRIFVNPNHAGVLHDSSTEAAALGNCEKRVQRTLVSIPFLYSTAEFVSFGNQ